MSRTQPAVSAWILSVLVFLFALLAGQGTAANETAPAPAVIVLDASGSMAARLPDGRTKLDAAREVIQDTLSSWPAGGELGLIAYGHRHKSDCSDIETLLPVAPLSQDAVTQALKRLKALGKTPLTASLESAAKLLPHGGTIVLVSDGVETCGADPCEAAAALRQANATLVIHVVGFGLKDDEKDRLACIAQNAGGRFFDAKEAEELTKALDTVKVEAAAPLPPEPPPPVAATVPAPAAEPAPEPAASPEPAKPVRTHLSAVISKLGAIVDAPVQWSVTDAQGASVYEGESRAVAIDLLPGTYKVKAQASNASGSTEIDVAEGQEQSFEVGVKAGRLDLSLAASPKAPALTDAETQGVEWSLTPLDGQAPASIAPLSRPSLLLTPGRYRISATLKDLSAAQEVEVKAGAAQEVVLNFRLGTIVLEAVLDGESQPVEDGRLIAWQIGEGAKAQRIEGQAKPSLTLPEGTYPVQLTIMGFDVAATATVKAGEDIPIQVKVPGGTLALSGRLGPQSPPLDDWRDTFWTIAPIETLTAGPPIETQETMPTLPLPAGRWRVSLQSGATTVETEIRVAPGEHATLSVELDAARLTMTAVTADGAPVSSVVVYAATAIDGTGKAADSPAFVSGSSEGVSTILPAGRWRLTADDTDGHHGETDVDLEPGEEISSTLAMR